MSVSLFSSYTNRKTGVTTVMHGTKLCGYVTKCLDEERRVWARGFYYACEIIAGGARLATYCEANDLRSNIAHVQREWEARR